MLVCVCMDQTCRSHDGNECFPIQCLLWFVRAILWFFYWLPRGGNRMEWVCRSLLRSKWWSSRIQNAYNTVFGSCACTSSFVSHAGHSSSSFLSPTARLFLQGVPVRCVDRDIITPSLKRNSSLRHFGILSKFTSCAQPVSHSTDERS